MKAVLQSFRRKVIYAFLLTAVAQAGLHAQITLSTVPPYNAGNGQSGVTFNVTAATNVTVTSLACAFSAAPTNVDVWYSTTPISGPPNVSATTGWTKVGTVASITAINASPTPTPIPLALSIPITAGKSYGFCISIATGTIAYTGTTAAPTFPDVSDGNITINTGVNVGFGGAAPSPAFTVRQFNGSVTYTLGSSGGGGPVVPPIASFSYNALTDTIWLGSPHVFGNTSGNYPTATYWDVTGFHATSPTGPFAPYSAVRKCNYLGCWVDSVYNLRWKFTERGYYTVKLLDTNSAGMDVITRVVFVDTPSHLPVADFSADRFTIGFTESTLFTDRSTNCATAWQWGISPGYIGQKTYLNNGDPNKFIDKDGNNTLFRTDVQNPFFYPTDAGEFDVWLKVWNARGTDSVYKQKLIRVVPSHNMCGGSDLGSTLSEAFLYDPQGPGANYTASSIGQCAQGFKIAPCTDTVTLTATLVKLAPGDTVFVYSASSAVQSQIVAKIYGTAVLPQWHAIKGNSGVLFVRMVCTSTSTTMEGVALKWTSSAPTFPKPTAAFSAPDTIYNGYTVNYTNRSTGVKMSYEWDTNGDGVSDSITEHPSQKFTVTSSQTRTICLVTFNCIGRDTFCKTVRLLPLSAKPAADFTVNRTTGFTTDAFAFTDRSTNGPSAWEWTFTIAGTSTPASVTFLNGTSATSQHPEVMFNGPKTYTVQLKASNAFGDDVVIKSFFVTAIAYATPTSLSDPSAFDIGISRVQLNTIDTTTAMLGAPPTFYQGFYNEQVTTLYRGVDYTLSAHRTGNATPMTTKAWIDYNRNASFAEAGELILHERAHLKLNTSVVFRIPPQCAPGNTRLRIGVSIDSAQLTDEVAQKGCFEDYGIVIGTDHVPPVLSLKGSAVVKIQQGMHYDEKGALAIDNLEGDISDSVKIIGSVDSSIIGYHTLTYVVKDLYGNVSNTVSRVVQVEVNQRGPKIALTPPLVHRIPVFTQVYPEPGYSATDYLGNSLPASLIVKNGTVDLNVTGTYSVKYKVTDAFGFSDSSFRTVIVEDTVKPVIFLSGGGTIYKLQTGASFNPDPVRVTDQYDKQPALSRAGNFDIWTKGTYYLKYDAVDAAGNKADPFYLTLKVGDHVPPTIRLYGDRHMKVEVFSAGKFADIDPGVEVDDNMYPNQVIVTTVSNVNMNVLGTTYEVTYTARDPEFNTASVTRTVTVQDTKPPMITLLGQNPAHHYRHKEYKDAGVQLQDNYYPDSVLRKALIVTSGVVKDIPGPYYVTYEVTDPSGNRATASRLVQVSENPAAGIDEAKAGTGIVMFPNPTTGKLTILGERISGVSVYTLQGQLVKHEQPNAAECTIELGELGSGMYLVKVEGAEGRYMQKVHVLK